MASNGWAVFNGDRGGEMNGGKSEEMDPRDGGWWVLVNEWKDAG